MYVCVYIYMQYIYIKRNLRWLMRHITELEMVRTFGKAFAVPISTAAGLDILSHTGMVPPRAPGEDQAWLRVLIHIFAVDLAAAMDNTSIVSADRFTRQILSCHNNRF